jgi:hypothetical protein
MPQDILLVRITDTGTSQSSLPTLAKMDKTNDHEIPLVDGAGIA